MELERKLFLLGHPLECPWLVCPWNLPSLISAASTTTTLSLVSWFISGSGGTKSTPPDILKEMEKPKLRKLLPMTDKDRCKIYVDRIETQN